MARFATQHRASETASAAEKPVEKANAPTTTMPTPEVGRESLRWRTIFVVIALLVVAGFASSLNTGLYLDDHAHYQHLREGDWSYNAAVKASRLGIIGEVLDLWGRQEAGLKFYRPVAFFIMRVEYTLGGWQPLPMHSMSLLWHLSCSLLVAVIATKFFGRRFWGLVAGCLMAIHPAHVGTVYWIACQTELITTFFLLVGLLAYAKYACWPTPWLGTSWLSASAERLCDVSSSSSNVSNNSNISQSPTPSIIYAIISLICYGLALGCRENAALFPVVCWMGDRLIGTRRTSTTSRWPWRQQRPWCWIRWEHMGFAVVLAIYMLLRWRALGGFPVPPPPYLMSPSVSWAFVHYVGYKIAMYALGLFFFVPVVPVGSESYFAERWQIFYGSFAVVLLLIALIAWAYQWRRNLWWPLVWLACLIAPMMLVFASPHHLYLPSLGMVLIATAGLAAIAGAQPGRTSLNFARVRTAISSVVILSLALIVGFLTWCMSYTYVRGTLSEDLIIHDVLRQHQQQPLNDGDHLFFINLPMLAYYAVPAINQQLGDRHVMGHVLTFSPDLMCMEQPSHVQVLDRYRLIVRAPEGVRYLEGSSGTMLLGVMGMGQLKQGQTMDAGQFNVTITDMDDRGVRELLFTFKRPLDSPDYHIYIGSPQFLAYRLSSKVHDATTSATAQ